jgi:fimbrial chaperone protein
MKLLRALFAIGWVLGSLGALAGTLRVGPTRIDLSARHPVVLLEVQNVSDTGALAQIDTFGWAQTGTGDVLTPTTDLIATPVVLSLAPGETRFVRVGLRQLNQTDTERSYRLFVREVPPAFVAGTGLQFALRIGVPVFALPAGDSAARPVPVGAASELSWRWLPDIQRCMTVAVFNPAPRHERVRAAEILSRSGEVLWRAADPTYILAGSRRTLAPALCPPSIAEAATLRLAMESGGTLNLPVEAQSLVVDANRH